MSNEITYDFDNELYSANRVEAIVNHFIETKWDWRAEPQNNTPYDKIGIDVFYHNSNKYKFAVELKIDWQSFATLNLCFEIWSQKENDVLGWGLTCCAQGLFYVRMFPAPNVNQPIDRLQTHTFVVGEIIPFNVLAMKEWLPKWSKIYRHVNTPNKTYTTVNVLVPVHEVINKLASQDRIISSTWFNQYVIKKRGR